jgi:signal transduction histidine kinase/ActR/RegA family two-component response regulator
MVEDTDAELASLPREELVGRARALQTVLRVAHAVANARSLNDLAERFAGAVATYTRFPAVVVLSYVPARAEFEILAQHGFDESKFPPRTTLPAKGSLSGLAAQYREVMTTDDIASDDRVEPATRAALTANAYASGACAPVLYGDELLGSFNLIYPRGTSLAAGERRMLETLASSLGVAMAHQIVIARERELETQARRAQQLDSLGVLAGGIAHDFNNLLTGIVGSLDMARLLAEESANLELGELLEQTLAAAGRATSLVRQLLTFARGGEPARVIMNDLQRVIREVAAFAARGTSVRCDVVISEPLGFVELDEGQIAQVIQNLVMNACQASPSGALVRLCARRAQRPNQSPVVIIEVIDQGRGIAAEHLQRVFEPFFTARTGGTGLGLSVSHSIVRQHGGRLSVSSELGAGSTFTVELPALAGEAVLATPAKAPAISFRGRILVMDDELAVRQVSSALLTRLGFEVVSVVHGAEAVEVATRAAAAGQPFRAALLDLTVVGGLGAADISHDLRRVAPGIRLVLSSGFAPDALRAEWDAFLQKPYTIDELSTALRQALQPTSSSEPGP